MNISIFEKIKPYILKFEIPLIVLWTLILGMKLFSSLPVDPLIMIISCILANAYILLGHSLNHQLKENKSSALMSMIPYVAYYGVSILVIGMLFKVNEWPGLDLFSLGLILTCIGFLLVFIKFKEQEDYKRMIRTLAIHLALGSLFLVLS